MRALWELGALKLQGDYHPPEDLAHLPLPPGAGARSECFQSHQITFPPPGAERRGSLLPVSEPLCGLSEWTGSRWCALDLGRMEWAGQSIPSRLLLSRGPENTFPGRDSAGTSRMATASPETQPPAGWVLSSSRPKTLRLSTSGCLPFRPRKDEPRIL